jgi:hypothetical protein
MAKYLVLWEIDPSRAPADRKERGTAWAPLVKMVKQDIKDGKVSAWGSYDGGTKGFSIFEGTHVELSENLQQYYPYCKFEEHQLDSINDAAEVLKFLTS